MVFLNPCQLLICKSGSEIPSHKSVGAGNIACENVDKPKSQPIKQFYEQPIIKKNNLPLQLNKPKTNMS